MGNITMKLGLALGILRKEEVGTVSPELLAVAQTQKAQEKELKAAVDKRAEELAEQAKATLMAEFEERADAVNAARHEMWLQIEAEIPALGSRRAVSRNVDVLTGVVETAYYVSNDAELEEDTPATVGAGQ